MRRTSRGLANYILAGGKRKRNAAPQRWDPRRPCLSGHWTDREEAPELGPGWVRMSKKRPDGQQGAKQVDHIWISPEGCLLYTSPSPRD